MRVAVVLFTRDLRVHDHPALVAGCRAAEHVVPLFVFDPVPFAGLHAAPNRARFLVQALADLRASLRERGGDLVLRHGDPVTETLRLAHQVAAEAVFTSEDVTRYARTRERRLATGCERDRRRFHLGTGVTVVPPGQVRPAGGDHYRVFTPYWRAWRATRWRDPVPAPATLRLPPRVRAGALPKPADLVPGTTSREHARGGESAGRHRLDAWLAGSRATEPDGGPAAESIAGLAGYDHYRDVLGDDGTSRLSPYLHFGCLSPQEVAERVRDRAGAEPFLRQLAWRDFHHQVTAAFPDITTRDYRPRGYRWHDDTEAFAAWQQGRTGYPIVDAGMRQLRDEGWMHNRARLITASFLTKHLSIDWRWGAKHFMDLLVDGDIANNYGNWQWVAGTGNDTRPGRVLNPIRQARRFDPDGSYVRRYVPELAELAAAGVHTPWRLPGHRRRGLRYPAPIVDPDQRPAVLAARG